MCSNLDTSKVAAAVTDGSAVLSVFPELSRAAWVCTLFRGKVVDHWYCSWACMVTRHLAQDNYIAETVSALGPITFECHHGNYTRIVYR